MRFLMNQYKPSTASYFRNINAINWIANDHEFSRSRDVILQFHKSFPDYQPSKLIAIPNTHKVDLYVKEESSRFSLPSFKVLGASWGLYRCLVERFKLNRTDTSLADLVKRIHREKPYLTLVAATDGNHGRAVAYMAKLLGIKSIIFTPRNVLGSECDKIRSETGSEVIQLDGNYDKTVEYASKFTNSDPGKYVLIQDFAFDGYEDIPKWIAHGYTTICQEIPFEPDVIFIPAGAGCLAHGITLYYRSISSRTRVFVIEPDTSFTVNKSLIVNKPCSDPGDSNTIMDGLNCPTVSSIAYPILANGVSFSGLVSDHDCTEAMKQLKQLEVNSGPCGAVTYAAFTNFVNKMKMDGDLKDNNKVVLLSTEAYRDFQK
ncbi:hypothetical protein C6P45_001268 [Maudiozyma exigua]|uniref:Tryptophan synthase beta chain-like PALP domain-containing protein n=1 Tax=Maudiozyma exigua TaxID=34358 RepID=A0A9P6W3T8_MAUEX|nr:hypothetical protein C6P45_001268 [Kazachstania exigua]